MSPLLKRSLNWAGSSVAVGGIAFVGMRLHDYGAEIDLAQFGPRQWIFLAGLSSAYAAANLLLAVAWWKLLKQFASPVSRTWAIRCYGLSQLAKYLPGNIFHLAGRQALAMAAGVGAWPLVKSTLWELGLLSSTGALFALLVVPRVIPQVSQGLAVTAFTIAVIASYTALRRLIGTEAAQAFGAYVMFLAISASLFVAVAGMLDATTRHHSMIALGGAYVIAWLIGLVTPGAPAGVGVRELVLLYLMNGVMNNSDIVAAVILGRLVTVLGDFGYFAAASLMPKGGTA